MESFILIFTNMFWLHYKKSTMESFILVFTNMFSFLL